MKKLLKVLLMLVMVTCLINSNNNHTKANSNETYNYTYKKEGGNYIWQCDKTEPASFNKDDVLTFTRDSSSLGAYENGIITDPYGVGHYINSTSSTYTFTIEHNSTTREISGTKNNTFTLKDPEIITTYGIKFTNGKWQEHDGSSGYADIDPTRLAELGIEEVIGASTTTYKLNKNLSCVGEDKNTLMIEDSLYIVLGENIQISAMNGYGNVPINIYSNTDNLDIIIDGQGKELKLTTVQNYALETTQDIQFKNIVIISEANNHDATIQFNSSSNMYLIGDVQIEITNKGQYGTSPLALNFDGGDIKFSDYATVNNIEGNASGDREATKVALHKAANGNYVVPDGSNAKYAKIIQKVSDPEPTPSPSEPVVKDESCEKVIGPTWHWNNSKGICEDYGVVGTSTR